MTNSGGKPLMFAARAGHTETARVLLDAGADVNAMLKATPELLEKLCVCASVLVYLPPPRPYLPNFEPESTSIFLHFWINLFFL